MIEFLTETVLMLSLGVILYLMARALPRIDDTEIQPLQKPKLSWLTPILEKTDEKLKVLLERLFRRLKVFILKLDNFVSNKLNKFKKEEPKEINLPSEKEKIAREENEL